MVYGGLSAPLQIGDPLSKIPGLENVPRNIATLKTLNIDLARDDNDATLFESNSEGKPDTVEFANWDNLGGNVYTPIELVTVNGEYQPKRTLGEGEGGWQSFSFSNQSNHAAFNISFEHYADQDTQTGGRDCRSGFMERTATNFRRSDPLSEARRMEIINFPEVELLENSLQKKAKVAPLQQMNHRRMYRRPTR